MRNDIFYSAKQAVKYWWVSILIGLLAIGLGVWCIIAPVATFMALVMVFAITFVVSGILSIIFSVSNRKVLKAWGWNLASGIIDLVFGIILLALPPEVIALVLTYFVGFWVMFQSIWSIGTSVELHRNGVKGWGWLLTMAILGVIMSFIFILSPIFTASFILALISIALIAYGIFRIYLGIKFKSLHSHFDEIDRELKFE